ncbi:MAG: hypothetical protein ABIT76_14450 [Chthoniobacterales bacterium]
MRSFLFFLVLCGACYGGYRYLHRNDTAVVASVSPASGDATPASVTPPVDPVTGTPLAPCTRCQGSGTIRCTAPHCAEGWVDCPGKCLKLSVGRWEHMDVPGHDPKELWQKFTYPGGHAAWTTAHVGQVIEMRDHKAVNIGACPVCGGKAKVPCKICQSTGHIVCPVCHGRKFLPVRLVRPATPTASSSESHSAVPVKTRDDAIRLKDGSVIHGQIVVSDPTAVWVRQTNGGTIQIPKSKLLQPAGH